MSELENLEIFVFDIFEKSKIPEVISKLEEQLGPVEKQPHTVQFLGMTNKKMDETRYFLDVKNPNLIIDKVIETNDKGLVGNTDFAKEAIEKINFLGIDSDELPFFVLIMIIHVKKSLFNLEELETQIDSIERPTRLFMEEFNGVTRQIRSEKPMCPYFVNLEISENQDEIEKIIQNIQSTKLVFKNFETPEVNPSYGQKLRDLIPFKKLKKYSNLVSIPGIWFDTILFVGNIDQVAMNGLMTSFLLKYSSRKMDLERPKIETMIQIIPKSNENLIYPWGSAGTMIFLTCMFSWASFLEHKAPLLEKEFTDWRISFQGKIKTYNESELEKSVLDLEHNSTEIANSITEIGRLTRIIESTSEFNIGTLGNFPEIVVPPSDKTAFYHFWKSIVDNLGTGAYMRGIRGKTIKILEQVEKNVNQYQRENDLFSRNVNNIISLHHQKRTKKLSLLTLVTTLFVIGLTAIIVGITLYDFETANFDPIFTFNDPDIIIKEPHRLPSFEYRIPLEISSMTSNHYKISVWAIVDSLELYYYGPCFIKDISIVRPETTVVYLKADGDEITLEPRFDLQFEDTLPYFSPEKMERTVLTSVGEMEFAILAEDIQDKNNSMNYRIQVDLTMRTPGGLHFNAGEHCEKLGLN